MAFLADLTTLLLIASLALVHDPDSLDPLAPRLPLALILLPLVLAATALTRAAVAFRAPDALVTLALYLTAAGAATSVAPWFLLERAVWWFISVGAVTQERPYRRRVVHHQPSTAQ